MEVKNERIISFYANHPWINFEDVNLSFIDMFEKAISNIQRDNTKDMTNMYLLEIKEQKNKLERLQTEFEHLKGNIDNGLGDINKKLIDNKNNFIEEVKLILNNNLSERLSGLIEKSGDLIITKQENNLGHSLDKTTTAFIEKIKLIMRELLPEINNNSQLKMNDKLLELSQNIRDDIKTNLEKHMYQQSQCNIDSIGKNVETIKDQILSSQIHNLEEKINSLLVNIQQPILHNIDNSEKRLKEIIDANRDDTIKNSAILTSLEEYLNKYKGSYNKGNVGEIKLRNILTSLYPNGSIIDTTSVKESGDCILMRDNCDDILIETKEYDNNVPKDEVTKFIRDATIQNKHGIMLSHNTGIYSKMNYQIDYNNNKFLIYVHNTEYNQTKIKTAVDIIDSLSNTYKELIKNKSNDITITSEEMANINEEFSKFVQQKISLVNCVKDFEKKMNIMINELKIPTLEKILSSHYTITSNLSVVCDLCNIYFTDNHRSLAAHKRHCTNTHKNIEPPAATTTVSNGATTVSNDNSIDVIFPTKNPTTINKPKKGIIKKKDVLINIGLGTPQ